MRENKWVGEALSKESSRNNKVQKGANGNNQPKGGGPQGAPNQQQQQLQQQLQQMKALQDQIMSKLKPVMGDGQMIPNVVMNGQQLMNAQAKPGGGAGAGGNGGNGSKKGGPGGGGGGNVPVQVNGGKKGGVENSSGQQRHGCQSTARRKKRNIGLNLIALIPCKKTDVLLIDVL
ncbi:unnamed protein product [Camellia sinensis]